MAVPSNTTTAHSVIGNREDLADIIYDISPVDTPFLSNASRGSATSVYHEWQTDALAAAGANAQIEGDDATANAFTATTRVGNYCQIARKVVQVSGTQRAMNHAGVADEYSYQLAKRGREMKRDMEYALVRNSASSAGGAGTARTSAGIESWLSTNPVYATADTTATTAGFASGIVAAPVDGTSSGTFTKALLDTAIQNCWTQGGDPKIVMVGPFNKTKASGFSGIATLYKDVPGLQQATIIGAADYYVSNFGQHAIIANRFQREDTALILDMEYLGVAFLRNMQTEPLSKTGDSDRSMLITEFTLEVKNEAASAKVADLTTS